MKKTTTLVPALLLLVCACGSKTEAADEGGDASEQAAADGAPATPLLPETFLSSEVPAGAVGVKSLRERASGDAVVVRGEVKDFVAGRAIFTMVDHEFDNCSELEGDSCPTPWDYCCVDQTELAKGTATIEFRKGDKVVAATVKGFHDIDHLSDVTVVGTLDIDGAGNMSVIASALYVE